MAQVDEPQLPTFWSPRVGMALRWVGDPRTPEDRRRWNELEAELTKRRLALQQKETQDGQRDSERAEI